MTMQRVEDFCVGDGASLRTIRGTQYNLFVDHKGRVRARLPYEPYVTDGYWVTRERKNGADHRNMSWWEIKLFNWFGIIPEFER